jgi:hypothetical protein
MILRRGIFLLLITWVICSGRSTLAADSDFERLVAWFSNYYHVQPNYTPAADLDKSIIQMTQSFGMTPRDCAVFEKHDFSQEAGNEDFLSKVGDILGPTWRAVVRVHSRRGHEITLIYFHEVQEPLQVMMVSIERNEARVLRLEADAKQSNGLSSDSRAKSSPRRQEGGANKNEP